MQAYVLGISLGCSIGALIISFSALYAAAKAHSLDVARQRMPPRCRANTD